MGWWGPGVMQGDPAMDCEDFIRMNCLCLGDPDGDIFVNEQCFPAEDLNENQHNLFTLTQSQNFAESCDSNVFYQVWAFHVMSTGSEMTEKMRAAFINACDHDDAAIAQNPKRQESIQNFRAKILNYTGNAIQMPEQSKPLMDLFAEHFSAEKAKPKEPVLRGGSLPKEDA